MNWNRIIVGDPSPLLARSRDVHRGARDVAGFSRPLSDPIDCHFGQ
jgi:hypothetical protein